jgi:choline dehydrogenase-like flavoprotein
VQQEVGVCGDHLQEIWRPAGTPYNQTPVPVFPHAQVIARGFEKLGMKTAPLPLAVLTQSVGERKACIWDGWCDAGCPIGSLANPLVTYLPRALRAGATLIHDATVTAVRSSADRSRAAGATYRDANGRTQDVDASVVIVAASAIQNSRLLLTSGLGNTHDQLGRRVMIHLACPVFGLWNEETQSHMGPTGGQLLNQDDYAKQRESGPFGSYQWMLAQAMKPNDLLGIAMSRVDLHGRALDDFMRKSARGFAMMTGVVEDLPQDSNRVTLTDKGDEHGVPVANVEHSAHEQSVALWEHARACGIKIMQAGGAQEAWAGGIGPMHIMGGTAMGKDPQGSVTNEFGQLHDAANIFVAGASLFATAGGVNPTFTLSALAARSAHHLLNNWNSIAS